MAKSFWDDPVNIAFMLIIVVLFGVMIAATAHYYNQMNESEARLDYEMTKDGHCKIVHKESEHWWQPDKKIYSCTWNYDCVYNNGIGGCVER